MFHYAVGADRLCAHSGGTLWERAHAHHEGWAEDQRNTVERQIDHPLRSGDGRNGRHLACPLTRAGEPSCRHCDDVGHAMVEASFAKAAATTGANLLWGHISSQGH